MTSDPLESNKHPCTVHKSFTNTTRRCKHCALEVTAIHTASAEKMAKALLYNCESGQSITGSREHKLCTATKAQLLNHSST